MKSKLLAVILSGWLYSADSTAPTLAAVGAVFANSLRQAFRLSRADSNFFFQEQALILPPFKINNAY
jgi:hypothetical protein